MYMRNAYLFYVCNLCTLTEIWNKFEIIHACCLENYKSIWTYMKRLEFRSLEL